MESVINKEVDEYHIVKRKNKSKRQIVVLGDSMTKNIDKYKIKNKLRNNENIYIKSFPGANISDMHDYCRPSKKHSPDVFILHVGTNDLRDIKTPDEIANDIIKLAGDLKSDVNEVIISGIITRSDKLNTKGENVNLLLSSKCSDNGIGFIDNSDINTSHLNNSGIHLNQNGTIKLARNFLSAINL